MALGSDSIYLYASVPLDFGDKCQTEDLLKIIGIMRHKHQPIPASSCGNPRILRRDRETSCALHVRVSIALILRTEGAQYQPVRFHALSEHRNSQSCGIIVHVIRGDHPPY
jgi:hypothetical protein